MKKRLYILMIAAMSFGLVACGNVVEEPVEDGTTSQIEQVEETNVPEDSVATESTDTVEEEAEVSMGNPWTTSDKDGVLDATGFVMDAPAQATEVNYSYMAESKMAQLTYKYDGNDWVYRIQPAESLTDISGMNYEYDYRESGTVAGNEAEFLACTDPSKETEEEDKLYGVHIVNWYDSEAGATYSLSAAGYNTSGMDIQVFAEELYLSDKNSASNDVAKDSASEETGAIESAIFGDGLYDSKIEDSGFTVENKGDGTYKVELTVIHLCYLENGMGTVYETTDGDEMTVSAIDPSGNDIRYVIYQKDDKTYEVQFVESTWEYLPQGTIMTGYEKIE